MKFLVLAFFAACTFSCATHQLIKDKEYSESEVLFKQSAFNRSLQSFPFKENNGFITSVEKAWITLWDKKGENSQLEYQIKSLDQRQYTSISKEAEYFFFNETEDGYIPSEHEVVALHLINSMIYMQQQKWTDAEVEARRASYFLQNIFNQDQPHFDDPALRLWLAGIWMNLNNWNAAQVDLRRIYEMTNNTAVKKLSELEKPPAFFRLYFNGSGPELKWSETSITPEFLIQANPDYTFSASPWYQRHVLRNTVIRDSVLKSNYMAQYLGIKANSGSQRAVGFSFGNATRVLGLTLGGAIIFGGVYVAIQAGATTAGSGEAIGSIFGAGYLVGKYLWDEGSKIISTTEKGATAYEDFQFQELRTYRFVRLLPNQVDYEMTRDSQKDQINKLFLIKPEASTEVEYILNP